MTPPSQDQALPYLANDAFRTLKKGWRTHSTALRTPPPFTAVGGGALPRHPHSAPIINAQNALGHSLPSIDLGLPHQAILIPRDLFDALEYEVSREAWANLHAALHPDEAFTTLHKLVMSNGARYWYDRSGFEQAASAVRKLTVWLLEARLIFPLTPDQRAAYLAAKGEHEPRTTLDIVREAVGRGAA